MVTLTEALAAERAKRQQHNADTSTRQQRELQATVIAFASVQANTAFWEPLPAPNSAAQQNSNLAVYIAG